ncbi:acetyl-CoA carboxylase biotin carboxyl carrier protein [Brassicibacter mesophilus]|uniref:acetyl-CoA carboxylase biotin carboxyl carrier protein n=1 Tax=Brassicibacter mesophilus TaxID=745119 RepID=UPI003D220842
MDIKDIKDLILTIDKTSIEKVDIEEGNIKISISKKANSIGGVDALRENQQYAERSVQAQNRTAELEAEEVSAEEDIYIVKSPIVGTFYTSPSPDSPNFVNIGDTVEKGQPLCIIEAMKIMNEIECEVSGKVVEILVENEDIVEYGQPLMKLRR